MTTADQLRRSITPTPFNSAPSPNTALVLKAAGELDQRDDTITTLRAERDALARQVTPTWTNSPPTVPGWYWCKRLNWPEVPPSVEFIRTLDRLDFFYGETRKLREEYKGAFLWAGPMDPPPIPEPQEPPSGTQ